MWTETHKEAKGCANPLCEEKLNGNAVKQGRLIFCSSDCCNYFDETPPALILPPTELILNVSTEWLLFITDPRKGLDG